MGKCIDIGLFDFIGEKFDEVKINYDIKKWQMETNFKYSKLGMAMDDFSDTCKDLVNKPAEEVAKVRNAIEDKATDINPTLGKVINSALNIPSTILNGGDGLGRLQDEFPVAHIVADNSKFMRECARSAMLVKVDDLIKADHIYCYRCGYNHHGLYIGNSNVIHYSGGEICQVTLDEFLKGAELRRVSRTISPMLYDRDEIVNRAYYALGEEKYNLIINNCEHFVKWCRSGGETFNRTMREY